MKRDVHFPFNNTAKLQKKRQTNGKFSLGDWSANHGARVLSNEKSFVCGECGRSYNYQKSLIKHQKYECGIEPQFPCPFCAHRCKQKIHLVKHVRRIHHSELPKN
ncbi:Longitudinals lacking protein, isoforms A/B/D/L [Frankliniella fusca]|uniref:Longitudinals lacking protein, isoforms A/B/D/L n=1 Tax=Frankliniella fusca TaxID=407009 RepID=A0AAE1LDC0_9NEOP|nr:Longitudinals lacking protein, isoforms A/B/D/L [Frankliniella fusca]